MAYGSGKPVMLTVLLWVSIGVLAICLLLLGTMFYQFSHNENGTDTTSTVTVPASDTNTKISGAAVVNKDSLQALYATTIQQLDEQVDATRLHIDTLKKQFEDRLTQSNQLRNEITAVFSNSNSTPAEIAAVQYKIAALQQKVIELRHINTNVEAENRRLKNLLQQLAANRNANIPLPPSVVTNDNPVTAVKTDVPQTQVQVTDMRLAAIAVAGDREQETNQAQQAEKLLCSFMVRANGAIAAGSDIIIVVQQPGGEVLQKSTWESGTFETREGRRIYSMKVRYDNSRGDATPVQFYLNADRFERGNYIMQVYKDGNLVARVVKALG